MDTEIAGQELDASVGAKVMYEKRPRRYSQDILIAWKVVEKMRAQGWQMLLVDDGSNWSAQFEHVNGGSVFESSAPTAPHAICLAALDVVRG